MAEFTDTQNLDRANTITGFAGNQIILGRYRLVRVLGQGGMGVVWLARDEKLNRDIALKFLPDIVVNDRASLNDLIRETRRSLELTHPNIVRTYDFVQENSVAGISMEYVDSDTLRNLRIDQPNGVFEPPQVAEWVRQLCSALAYAHSEASIVHRDLKPANLMINGRGQLKVADFGIARSLVESVSHMTLNSGTSGTLVYMSPQQLSGDAASALDDIYALGSTLYELFTTRPPFYSGDISGQVRTKVAPSIAQRRSSLSIPVADFPSNWEETIAACLAKDPAQRPQSATEVAVRLGLLDAAALAVARPIPIGIVNPAPSVPATPPGLPFAVPPTGYGTAPTAPPAYGTAPTAPPAYGTVPTAYGTAPTAYGTAPTAAMPAYPTATVHGLPAAVPMFRSHQRNLYIALGAAALVLILALVGIIAHFSGNHQEVARQEQEKKDKQDQARLAASARGSLFVATDPSGALVRIGDRPPVKSPAPIQDLKPGKQIYEVELEGYDPVMATADIEENKMAQPPVIALVQSKGGLQITSHPDNLPVEIKSRANSTTVFHNTTPFTNPALPVGEYEVTVTREGWLPLKQTVEVRRAEQESRTFDFADGSLTLVTEPPGAKVILNGKEAGLTPFHQDGLRPGAVTYAVQMSGFEKVTATGAITAGQDLAPPSITLQKNVAVAATHSSGSSGRSRSGSSGRSGGRQQEEEDGHHKALDYIDRFLPFAPRPH